MKKLDSILVAIDRGEDARIAIAKAGMLAQRLGARVELFLCDAECAFALKHVYTSRGTTAAREASLAESRRYLVELRNSVLPSDVTCDIEVACESPLYESIVHKVQRSRPDLVIRALQGHTSSGLCLGGTNWALIRTCPVPVMLVGTRSWGRTPRIAAAVDISSVELPELTRAILEAAQYVASRTTGVLDVIHSANGNQPADRGAQATTGLLSKRAQEARVTAQLHVAIGDPARTLPALVAERRYDLLVVGTLSHRKGPDAVVGTLTGRLLEMAGCDLLLVKPPSYVSPVCEDRMTGDDIPEKESRDRVPAHAAAASEP
jgi:universal stress protein E